MQSTTTLAGGVSPKGKKILQLLEAGRHKNW